MDNIQTNGTQGGQAWSDERIESAVMEEAKGWNDDGFEEWAWKRVDMIGTVRAEELMKQIRADYEAQQFPVAASGGIPREIAQTMREAVQYGRANLIHENPNTFLSEWRQTAIDRADAALAWLSQHAPSED